MDTKHVGMRELRRDLAEHLQGSEPIVIERHDRVLGIYIPVKLVDREKVAAAIDQLHAAYEAAFTASGMTREEFARLIAGSQNDEHKGKA